MYEAGGHVAVRHRRQQQLAEDAWSPFVAHPLAGDRGEVPTGTPSGHGELARNAAKLTCMLARPSHRGERVVGRRGEARLRCMPIVHRNDQCTRAPAQVAQHRVVGIVATPHPTTTMEVQHQRVRSGGGRAVKPVLQRSVGARKRSIADLPDRQARAAAGCAAAQQLTGAGRSQRVEGGQIQRRQHLLRRFARRAADDESHRRCWKGRRPRRARSM